VTVLLTGFLSFVDMNRNDYTILELYAGEQRLVKLAKGLGMRTASMDRDYDDGDNKKKNNAMDLNTSAGFLFLTLNGRTQHQRFFNILRNVNFNIVENICWSSLEGSEMFRTWPLSPSTLLHVAGNPRLACCMVLGAKWGEFLALMGICCSTFVSMSRGSTFRSIFLPQGCPVSIAVYRANKALCRQEVHNFFGEKTQYILYLGFHCFLGYFPAGRFSYYSSS
jgi:hypothetical protein